MCAPSDNLLSLKAIKSSRQLKNQNVVESLPWTVGTVNPAKVV